MQIGIVEGNIVATVKHHLLKGAKLMIVQPMTKDFKRVDQPLIAVDTVDAGIGDIVLLVDEGNAARQIMKTPDAPVRTVIAGIVDAIST